MSSARRSWKQRREDAMASAIRTPADEERMRVEGQRQQLELIAAAEADGTITRQQAEAFRAKYGLSA